MKTINRPLRTTIVYGLLCGLLFVPITSGLRSFVYPQLAFPLTVWLCIAGYSILLAGWGKKKPATLFFPLLLLLGFLLLSRSTTVFLFLAIGVLSWIRSSLCFEKSFFRMLFAEFFISVGGGVLVVGFAPNSAIGLALGIWLFFLIQSVYFVLFADLTTEEMPDMDPFGQASRQAEKILRT